MQPVVGYEQYTVDQIGNVSRDGRVLKWRILATGRAQVVLSGKAHAVHRLVAKAFVANPDNKPQVNHIDGNPLNNSVDNLEWCTGLENIQKDWQTGRRKAPPMGDLSYHHKLTEEQVEAIRWEISSGDWTQREIAEHWGISQSLVSCISNGKRRIIK